MLKGENFVATMWHGFTLSLLIVYCMIKLFVLAMNNFNNYNLYLPSKNRVIVEIEKLIASRWQLAKCYSA
jgi:hypothetical protein